MINIETDRHGRTYQIWQQQQMSTCGVAAAWMARGILRQMSFAEDEWALAQRIYLTAVQNALAPLGHATTAGPMTMSPVGETGDQSSFQSTFTGGGGLYARQLAQAMRSEGFAVEHRALANDAPEGSSLTVQHWKIAWNRPAIAMIYWRGGGGHFVVVGRCTRRDVTYLDPADGHVNELDNDGLYCANYGDVGNVGEILYLSIPPR